MQPRSSKRGIQSIEVGGRLLQVLVERGTPMMLRDLAAASGMPAAKAHRYLVSFIRMGLAEQDAQTGRYDLGELALRLGLVSLARMDPVRLGTPVLAELRDEIEETCALAVWGNYGATVVRWEEPARAVTVNLRAGGVLPLLTSATGLCFAAFFQAAQTEKLLRTELAEQHRNPHATGPHTYRQAQELLATIRKRGLSRIDGTLIPGVAAFSAPVFGPDARMVLALTVLGHAGAFDTRWTGRVASALCRSAANLSKRLGAGSYSATSN
jgi:DNA-binding IclR family transcriptional regulator